MTVLTFFTTAGCHLCDEAKALLVSLHRTDIQFDEIEIADSDALVEAYGTRIPVLTDRVSGAELNWPFDVEQLKSWLAKAGQT